MSDIRTNCSNSYRKPLGFTIVELMVVVVILGILAGLTTFALGNWQNSSAEKVVKSDLLSAAAAFQNEKNFQNEYPTTAFPASVKTSKDVVLELTSAAAGKFCLNGYDSSDPLIRRSITSDSITSSRSGLCPGVGVATIGGSIPAAPLNTNVAEGFSEWTLSGTATYATTTGELTLGTNGTARSPFIRVSGRSSMTVNGSFYATVQSPQLSLQPNGGWHAGSSYFAADGVTPATSTAGYTGNGCAKQVTLASWNPSRNGACSFGLGPNIVYVRIVLYSTASGYSSSDLKVKSPEFLLN